jgi:hypothetical protein
MQVPPREAGGLTIPDAEDLKRLKHSQPGAHRVGGVFLEVLAGISTRRKNHQARPLGTEKRPEGAPPPLDSPGSSELQSPEASEVRGWGRRHPKTKVVVAANRAVAAAGRRSARPRSCRPTPRRATHGQFLWLYPALPGHLSDRTDRAYRGSESIPIRSRSFPSRHMYLHRLESIPPRSSPRFPYHVRSPCRHQKHHARGISCSVPGWGRASRRGSRSNPVRVT